MKIFTFSYLVTLFWVLLLPLAPAAAQQYQLPTKGTASYTTCAGTLYDDGGPTDPYDGEATGSVTLLPGTAGGKLKLEFKLLELDSVHTAVWVYDGTTTSAPLIGRFYHGLPTVYATGSVGALTVVLTASGGLPLRGFAAAISCVASIPRPDLAAQNVQVLPTTTLAGDFVTVTSRIANLVGGLAPYRLTYLLSTDTQRSANDVSLSLTDAAAATGSWVDDWRLLQLPAGTAPGTYYVLCVAQYIGNVPELDGTNNLVYTTIRVLAPTPTVDLAVTAVQLSTRPFSAGNTLDMNVRLQNLGTSLAVPAPIGYYLSTDAVLSADDRLMGVSPAGLPTTDRYTLVYSYGEVTIPAGTAPGSYYLLAVADYLDQVIEDNEQNNAFARPLTIVAPSVDVNFSSFRSLTPGQAAAGGPVLVSCYPFNQGTVPLDSTTVGYFLSADRFFSADDVLLGRATVGPLQPANAFNARLVRTLALPGTTPLGRRYVLLVGDYRNEVAESDETNNVLALPLEVVVSNVDLAPSALALASIYGPVVGNAVINRFLLKNLGTTQAYPAPVGYFLSTDSQLSPDDQLLSQVSMVALAGGGSQTIEVSGSDCPVIPAGTAPGSYYLLAVADYLHQVAETNEDNNSTALAIRVVQPNIDLLLPGNFEVLPTRAAAGTEVLVKYYLQNSGTSIAYAPTVGFYVSTDNTLSADDIWVGGERLRASDGLYPTYSQYRTSSFHIPPSLAPGRYYVLGVADYLNEFAESDEQNNLRYAPLEVTTTRPDLLVVAAPFVSPKRAAAGSQVSTESYVYNVGAGLATPSQTGYYLSTNPTLSPDDVLLGSTPTGDIQPGYSTIVADKATLPASTAAGRYYVLFVADYLHQTNDLDQSNNTTYTTLTVTPLPLAAREQTAGYTLSVSPNPVAGPTPLRVLLSGQGPRSEVTLALLNSLGQQVATQPLSLLPGRLNQASFDMRGLAAGVYLLRLTGPDLNATRRLVVE